MNILVPFAVTDATLFSINVPEDDHAVWSGVTTYARGDYAISLATHTVYRSLQDGNLNNDPDLEAAALADPLIDNPDPVQWQIMGATNRWRMFDSKPSQKATQAGSIEFEVRPGVFIGGIAGFGISADDVRVRAYSDADLIYDHTVEMRDETAVLDWLSYFISPYSPLAEFVLTDLPLLGSPRIVVTLSGAVVEAGQIVLGQSHRIGTSLQEGAGFAGLDFSYVQTDEFGNLTTVQREATKISDFSVSVRRENLFAIARVFNRLRGGIPAVWIASDNDRLAAVNYGYYRGWRTVYVGADHAEISIEVQGIV
ncbi:MAG: hypothetical protein ACPG61_11515 [Paracoccaceae bacterium]